VEAKEELTVKEEVTEKEEVPKTLAVIPPKTFMLPVKEKDPVCE
jgi:hypothetical protein